MPGFGWITCPECGAVDAIDCGDDCYFCGGMMECDTCYKGGCCHCELEPDCE